MSKRVDPKALELAEELACLLRGSAAPCVWRAEGAQPVPCPRHAPQDPDQWCNSCSAYNLACKAASRLRLADNVLWFIGREREDNDA